MPTYRGKIWETEEEETPIQKQTGPSQERKTLEKTYAQRETSAKTEIASTNILAATVTDIGPPMQLKNGCASGSDRTP